MSDQPVNVRNVSWADLCPWTIIFRTLSPASSITVLALALVGVLAASFTWWLSENIFIASDSPLRENAAFVDVVGKNTSPFRGVFADAASDANSLHLLGAKISGPRAVFNRISEPFGFMFRNQIPSLEPTGAKQTLGTAGFLYFLFGSACSLAIWGFFGLAIARVSLLRITRNETIGIDDAVDYACDHWLASVGGLGAPIGAVFAMCIPMFLLGLLMTFDLGAALVGILWIVVLAGGTIMALLLLGLTFAWPLIVSSVGCEGQNAFDAMTRAYAYVFQRPLHYLLYAVVAMLFGGFCWMIVAWLSGAAIELGYWGTSWGANRAGGEVPRIEVIQGLSSQVQTVVDESGAKVLSEEHSSTLGYAQSFIGFWNGLIRTVAVAFLYGLFWCMASSIYLLLRKDVDDTEMDEIFIVDERRTYELPPLKSDEQGIPQVQKPTPVDENSDDKAEETEEDGES